MYERYVGIGVFWLVYPRRESIYRHCGFVWYSAPPCFGQGREAVIHPSIELGTLALTMFLLSYQFFPIRCDCGIATQASLVIPGVSKDVLLVPMAKPSPITRSSVGASNSPCNKVSNTANSVELTTVWMKYVEDGDVVENINNGNMPIATAAEAELIGPDFSTIEMRMFS